MLLSVVILLFVLAALLGITLLLFILFNKETPKALAFLHGPLAVIAFFLLILYAILYKPTPIISIVLFALAAMGGVILIYKDLTGKPIPKPLAIGHGLLAITALCFLWAFAYLGYI